MKNSKKKKIALLKEKMSCLSHHASKEKWMAAMKNFVWKLLTNIRQQTRVSLWGTKRNNFGLVVGNRGGECSKAKQW